MHTRLQKLSAHELWIVMESGDGNKNCISYLGTGSAGTDLEFEKKL